MNRLFSVLNHVLKEDQMLLLLFYSSETLAVMNRTGLSNRFLDYVDYLIDVFLNNNFICQKCSQKHFILDISNLCLGSKASYHNDNHCYAPLLP